MLALSLAVYHFVSNEIRVIRVLGIFCLATLIAASRKEAGMLPDASMAMRTSQCCGASYMGRMTSGYTQINLRFGRNQSGSSTALDRIVSKRNRERFLLHCSAEATTRSRPNGLLP